MLTETGQSDAWGIESEKKQCTYEEYHAFQLRYRVITHRCKYEKYVIVILKRTTIYR